MLLCAFVQVEVLTTTWPVFDKYRDQFLLGELIWNYQDFETGQGKPLPLVVPPQSMILYMQHDGQSGTCTYVIFTDHLSTHITSRMLSIVGEWEGAS